MARLRYDVRLERASQRHSGDMVRRRFFEHATPEGVTPQSLMLLTSILQPGFTEVGVGVGMGAPERAPTEGPAATYTTDFGGPPQR